jgi:hypothetical protein
MFLGSWVEDTCQGGVGGASGKRRSPLLLPSAPTANQRRRLYEDLGSLPDPEITGDVVQLFLIDRMPWHSSSSGSGSAVEYARPVYRTDQRK